MQFRVVGAVLEATMGREANRAVGVSVLEYKELHSPVSQV
jgi:hypothetical protein